MATGGTETPPPLRAAGHDEYFDTPALAHARAMLVQLAGVGAFIGAIRGAPGSGKSRLLRQLARDLQDAPRHPAVCLAGGESGVLAALAAAFGLADGTDPAETRRTLIQHLAALHAQHQVPVALIDDVERLNSTDLALLIRLGLSADQRRSGLLSLVLAGSGDLESLLESAGAGLTRQRIYTVTVPALSPEESRAYLGWRFGPATVARLGAAAEALVQRADGNPGALERLTEAHGTRRPPALAPVWLAALGITAAVGVGALLWWERPHAGDAPALPPAPLPAAESPSTAAATPSPAPADMAPAPVATPPAPAAPTESPESAAPPEPASAHDTTAATPPAATGPAAPDALAPPVAPSAATTAPPAPPAEPAAAPAPPVAAAPVEPGSPAAAPTPLDAPPEANGDAGAAATRTDVVATPPAPRLHAATPPPVPPPRTATRPAPQRGAAPPSRSDAAVVPSPQRPANGRATELRDDEYVVQIAAAGTTQTLRAFAARANLRNPLYLQLESQGRVWQVLALGPYPDRTRAESALAQLPDDVRGAGAWVRSGRALRLRRAH